MVESHVQLIKAWPIRYYQDTTGKPRFKCNRLNEKVIMTTRVTTCTFLLVFMLLQRSALAQDEAPDANAAYVNPNGFLLLTRVFNAYPNTSVTAFIAFENERISRLRYGELAVLNVTLEPHSDYLIQFRQIPTEGQIRNLRI